MVIGGEILILKHVPCRKNVISVKKKKKKERERKEKEEAYLQRKSGIMDP